MEHGNLDLCAEIQAEMCRLGYSAQAIAAVINSNHFMMAQGKPDNIQRTMLIMVFHTVMLNAPSPIPSHIRIALNISNDVTSWLSDMKLVILPFLKENESVFFPAVN